MIEQRKIPEMISGYEYEVLDCMKAMKAGRIESDMMPHSETLKLMELMDTLRAQWGMKLPCE